MSNWTPGPWPISEQWMGGIKQGPFHIGRPNHAHVKGKANAELIALAPEMAEAIMLWSDATEESCRIEANDLIEALAVKLRQIGATNE